MRNSAAASTCCGFLPHSLQVRLEHLKTRQPVQSACARATVQHGRAEWPDSYTRLTDFGTRTQRPKQWTARERLNASKCDSLRRAQVRPRARAADTRSTAAWIAN
eukprot:6191524-Pleurochrysis_carterae.AAC.2